MRYIAAENVDDFVNVHQLESTVPSAAAFALAITVPVPRLRGHDTTCCCTARGHRTCRGTRSCCASRRGSIASARRGHDTATVAVRLPMAATLRADHAATTPAGAGARRGC